MFLYILFATLICYLFFKSTRKPEKFPPGPPKLPLVGSVPFVGVKGSFLHTMKYVVEKYGPVSGIFMGSKPALIISDFNILKGKKIQPEVSLSMCV